MLTHLLGRLLKTGGLIEADDLGFVGKQDVDVVLHQVAEAVAVAIHAEGIREAQGHFTAIGFDLRGRRHKGAFGFFGIPEVALEVEHLGPAHHRQIDVIGIEMHRRPQERVHGALGIRGDEDHAAGCRGTALHGRGVEQATSGAQIVGKDAAQLVVAHAANEASTAAELGDGRHGVGHRAARGFNARAHGAIEGLGLLLINQGHGALGEPLAFEESVVALGEHINDGVANANDIEGCRGGGHALSSARLGPWMGSSTTMV